MDLKCADVRITADRMNRTTDRFGQRFVGGVVEVLVVARVLADGPRHDALHLQAGVSNEISTCADLLSTSSVWLRAADGPPTSSVAAVRA